MQAKCFMSLFLKEDKLPTFLHLTVMEPNPEPDYPIYHHHDHHHSISNMDTPVNTIPRPTTTDSSSSSTLSRYENQKRRDWNTFCQYLGSHRPPIPLATCTGMHVLDFLRYQDQFGKTKVHNQTCPFFGLPSPPAPCPCPLRQAWGSLDALLGRLRAAYEENGGDPGANPFGARGLRVYLKEVRDYQAKARGVSYEKKRKRPKEKKGPSP